MPAEEVDFSILPEVLTEVREHLAELERDLHKLVQNPANNDLLSSAFRHMHTIKGDFGYCHAEPIMDFVHVLEGVLQTLRERRYQCSALIAEACIQGMDQIQDMMEVLASTRGFDATPRERLEEQVRALAQARTQEEADQAARLVLMAIHTENALMPEQAASPDNIARAKALGQELCTALETREPGLLGRAELQLRIVSALNAQYLQPCNADALELAVLWHDAGLLALPDALLMTPPLPKTADWPRYASHPALAANWLLTIAPDCTEAARIIRQHHQGINNTGIVAPDDPQPPHPGAQMLACADLLWEHAGKQSGEAFRRGLLRTLFEVNAGLESRFDATLINACDVVVKALQTSR